MMRFEPSKVLSEFEEAFGIKRDDMTPSQIMFLVKFSKHVRGRCRANNALHNYLRQAFPNMTFREVPREWKGKSYTALQINGKEGATTEEGNDEE